MRSLFTLCLALSISIPQAVFAQRFSMLWVNPKDPKFSKLTKKPNGSQDQKTGKNGTDSGQGSSTTTSKNGGGGNKGDGSSTPSDQAAKRKFVPDPSDDDDHHEHFHDEPPPSTTPPTSSSQARTLGKFYPMCIFVDETQDAGAVNKGIKGMIDEAANSCSVHLVVYPVTIKALPKLDGQAPGQAEMLKSQAERLNNLQKTACNITDHLGGKAKAASTTICTNSEQLADAMCVNTERRSTPAGTPYDVLKYDTGGCAQLQKAGGGSANWKEIIDATKKATKGGKAENLAENTDGRAAASLIDNGGCGSAGLISHEALGHSQMGKPNGKRHGHGIGEHDDKEMGGSDEPWMSGCGEMQANSFADEDLSRYDPSRQIYYQKPADSAQVWDLNSGKPFFTEGTPVPPPGAIEVPQYPDNGGGSPQNNLVEEKPMPANPNPVAVIGGADGGHLKKVLNYAKTFFGKLSEPKANSVDVGQGLGDGANLSEGRLVVIDSKSKTSTMGLSASDTGDLGPATSNLLSGSGGASGNLNSLANQWGGKAGSLGGDVVRDPASSLTLTKPNENTFKDKFNPDDLKPKVDPKKSVAERPVKTISPFSKGGGAI